MTFGTNDNLPRHVREIAMLTSRVIAWTALDPRLASDVDAYACCVAFGPCIVIPCFWPFLVICLPCHIDSKMRLVNLIKSTYWILTDTDLKVVTSDSVKSIPLESITACGTEVISDCCVDVEPLPRLFVDTISQGNTDDAPRHYAEGIGFANQDWFVCEVLKRRDIVKGSGVLNNSSPQGVIATPVMERGSVKSAADRLEDVTKLRMSDRITQTEFEKLRQEILESI